MKIIKNLSKRTCALMLSILTVLSCCVGLISFNKVEVEAAGAGISVKIKRTVRYKYDGEYIMSGSKFWGNSGQTDYSPVYCLKPAYASPLNDGKETTFSGDKVKTLGSSAKAANGKTATEITNNIYKAVYYAYGGPGYTSNNNAIKNLYSTYRNKIAAVDYDSEEKLDADNFGYVMNHILFAYLYAGNSSSFSGSGTSYNPTIPKYYEAAKEIWNKIEELAEKENYRYGHYAQIYTINTGKSDTQIMLYVVTKGVINLKKQCVSACSDFVKNNSSCYSLEGASFNVFKTKKAAKYFADKQINLIGSDAPEKTDVYNHSDYVGNIVTNADGNGTGGSLGTNTKLADRTIDIDHNLYVVEYKAPKGYATNYTVYTLNRSGIDASTGLPQYVVSGDGNAVNDTPKMVLEINKKSTKTSLTDGNKAYSLKGAVYTVYTDEACTKEYKISGTTVTITTNESGYGSFNSKALIDAKQTLYCKETNAPDGYETDTAKYTFVFSGKYHEKTYTYKYTNSEKKTITNSYKVSYPIFTIGKKDSSGKYYVYDKPLNDPVTVLLKKYNASTDSTSTDISLAGAEFRVCYYAGYASGVGDTAGVAPTRTWYFETDENGVIRLDETYLSTQSESDDLYYDDDGYPVIPYGCIVIQETKAPAGYQINTQPYFTNINSDTDTEDLDWRTSNKIIDTGVLDVPETPNYGGLVIEKSSSDDVVSNVWFSVYEGTDTTGKHIGTYCTDENGVITNSELDKLTEGTTYTVVEEGFKDENGNFYIPSKRYGEVPPPVTFVMGEANEDNDVYYEEVDGVKKNTVVFNNSADIGKLIIQKTSDDNNVEGVYFEITTEAGDKWIDCTKANGNLSLTLPRYDFSGEAIEYTVTELGFPDNNSETGYSIPDYFLTPELQTVTLTEEGGAQKVNGFYTKYVDFKNEYIPLRIDLQKCSDDDYKEDNRDGVWFNITSDSDETLDRNVFVKFTNETAGWFGKSIGATIIRDLPAFTKDGSTITYTITELGYATAYDEEGNPTEFEYPEYLYDVYRTRTVSAVRRSSANADDDEKDNTEDIVLAREVTKNGNTYYDASVQYINRHVTGKVLLNKTSYDNNIEGIYFKLTNEKGYEDIQTTDGNGNITWSKLDVWDYSTGEMLKYTLTELGFLQSDGTYSLGDKYVKQPDVTFYIDESIREDAIYENSKNYAYLVQNENGAGMSKTLSFYNDTPPGDLLIYKESEDGVISNIYFNVQSNVPSTAADGTELSYTDYGTVVTDSEGKALLTDLPVYNENGEKIVYTVTELGICTNQDELDMGIEPIYEIPYRYKTPSSQSVTLTPKNTTDIIEATKDNTAYVVITNNQRVGSVTLKKVDPDGNALTGSEWKLYRKADDTLVPLRARSGPGTYDYDVDGTAQTLSTAINSNMLSVYSLPQGDYYFVETKAATYHQLLTDPIEFSIKGDSKETLNIEVTAENEPQVGKLNIYKESEDGDVADYYFNVCVKDESGKTVIKDYGDVKTDSTGKVILSGLRVYDTNGDKIPYTVKELGKLTNADEVKNDGADPVYKIPYKYKTPTAQTVTLYPDGSAEVASVTITNTLKLGNLYLKKTDPDGKALAGSRWQLYKADGTLLPVQDSSGGTNGTYSYSEQGTYTGDLGTTSNGALTIYSLPQGDYYIKETVAPTGYDLLDAPIEFTISGESSETLNVYITVTNSPKLGDLLVYKTSEDKDIEDYYFNVCVKDSEGNVTADYGDIKTDENGKAIRENLLVYDDSKKKIVYTVTELGKLTNADEVENNGAEPVYEIPYRYNTPTEQTVTLTPKSAVVVGEASKENTSYVEFNNTLKKGSLTLQKTDADDNSLAGSQWELRHASGAFSEKVTQTGTGRYSYDAQGSAMTLDTDEDGMLVISELPQGTYWLAETKAPEGQQLLKEPIKVIVSGDSDEALNVSVTVADTKKPILPPTGGGNLGMILLCVAGVFVVTGGTYFYLVLKRKRSKG